ncbi:U-box domain-containing protein 9 [Nymphaea thermarum]|nr:U-box domain-containing protein 9 [Nymphaea thermarum]
MARSERSEAGASPSAKASELKRVLERLVREIPDEEGSGGGECEEGGVAEVFDRISKTVAALRDLKLRRTLSQRLESAAVPEQFICPISSELMKDPVVLATGQTYDRAHIQAWLNNGHRTCPRTQQVLSHLILTPNYLVRNMIQQWCESQGIELPAPQNGTGDVYQEGITQGDRVHLDSLLQKIAFPSMEEQKQAAKELRLLTKRASSFRTLLGQAPDAMPLLLSLLSRVDSDLHPEVQEDVVTTILNLSIHDDNKKLVAEAPEAIPLLIKALKSGTMQTRSNSAAALFSLSALDANKIKIGEAGAIGPLIELLDQGSTMAKKDAASAIFNLCIMHDNRARAVRHGAIPVLLNSIKNESSGLVDESLAILSMLSSYQQALEEIVRNGGVQCLLDIIRENTSERNRENAVATLYSVCWNDRSKLREVREEEDENSSLSLLTQNGTSRARRKAAGILDRVRRFTNTA